MSESSFGGLWSYPSTMCPEHTDFMFIDEGRGMIIGFYVVFDDPPKWGPMRHWYRPVSATSISARLRAPDAWRDHGFQLEGDCLAWTYGGKVHTWRRVPWEDRPDWLDARLATENLRMDATEEAG